MVSAYRSIFNGIGILEGWNSGMMGRRGFLQLLLVFIFMMSHYSIIPVFHYSIFLFDDPRYLKMANLFIGCNGQNLFLGERGFHFVFSKNIVDRDGVGCGLPPGGM